MTAATAPSPVDHYRTNPPAPTTPPPQLNRQSVTGDPVTSHNPPTTQQLDEYERLIADTTPQGAAAASPGMARVLLAEVRRLNAELAAEKAQHDYTFRQRNNRSERLLHLRDLAEAGDTEALMTAAQDVLAASVNDHQADTEQPSTEPFRFVDDDGDYLHIGIPHTPANGGPAVSFHTATEPVHVPVDRIEELITVLRRLAAAQSPSAAAGAV